jgi:hypothetical protein
MKIYNENVPSIDGKPRLRLIQDGNKVLLAAVDNNGEPHECGHIMTISEQRGVSMHYYVSAKLGLPIDHDGRVVVFKKTQDAIESAMQQSKPGLKRESITIDHNRITNWSVSLMISAELEVRGVKVENIISVETIDTNTFVVWHK